MFEWIRRQFNKKVQGQLRQLQDELPDSQLDIDLAVNMKTMDSLFDRVDILISRPFETAGDDRIKFCMYFTDGVVNSQVINEYILKPLLQAEDLSPDASLFDSVKSRLLPINDIKEATDFAEIIRAVTYGDTLLLIDGCNRAMILSSKTFTLRSPGEPDGEKVLIGPREGFNEGVLANVSMVRRRLRTNQLKLEYQTIGRESNTTICIAYLDNIVNKKLLKELKRRLDTIDIDGVLDSNYITEHIAESSPFGFTTCGYTERPDVVSGKLLEGRIAVFVDGTPQVLTLPYLLVENFQSNEDYYVNPGYASFSRLLRIFGFILTITIPGLYIAIVAFHHEILPTTLMINITNERQGVPLPAALEAFVMLLMFDILRETGLRMPTSIGQAMSIVGALVIGQAAVEAKMVAAPMIIVVALTGITSLLLPRMSATAIISRYFCLALCSVLGILGLIISLSVLVIHVLNLRSFGVPCLMLPRSLREQEVKDLFVRFPWPKMLTRQASLTSNVTRSRPSDAGFRVRTESERGGSQ